MARKILKLDTGIQEFEFDNGSILRFNPADPNIYNRFCEVYDELPALEEECLAEIKSTVQGTSTDAPVDVQMDIGKATVSIMAKFDVKIKDKLNYIFGAPNDFNELLHGVNLLAVGNNGERVITNVLATLAPIIEAGAKKQLKTSTGPVIANAKANRQQRRAIAKGAKK